MAFSFLRFLDHTQRRSTVGKTPLDEWSARRKDLYLTTHNTHNRQTSMPPVGFEPTISAGERPQTYTLDRGATGTGILFQIRKKKNYKLDYVAFYLKTLSIAKIIMRQWQTDGTSLLTAGRMIMTGEHQSTATKTISQYHFFQHRSCVDCFGKEPTPMRVRAGN